MANKSVKKLFDDADRASRSLAEFAVQPSSPRTSPTIEVSREWQFAFSYFNERLFGNTLPDCIITFTKTAGVQGYFCAGAFRDHSGNVAHEIAMNPVYFAMGDAESFATLVHEMAHLWRHVFGRPNRKGGRGAPGYHDAVWADRMEAIGLMPTHTGKPGGRRTGFQMRDYPIEGGPFDLACRELLISGHMVNWRDGRELVWVVDPFGDADTGGASFGSMPTPASKNTRTRFVCEGCGLRAWSRSSAKLSCTDCNRPLFAR